MTTHRHNTSNLRQVVYNRAYKYINTKRATEPLNALKMAVHNMHSKNEITNELKNKLQFYEWDVIEFREWMKSITESR